MTKFIVAFNPNNVISLTVPTAKTPKGEVDMATMVKHVQSIVGTETKFQVA